MDIQPTLPPQAVPAAAQSPNSKGGTQTSSALVFGRAATDWVERLKRCPFDGREKRIKWLGTVERLAPECASKVLALVGDQAKVSVDEYIDLIFGAEDCSHRQLLNGVLEIAHESGGCEVTKEVEAIAITKPAGMVLVRRADAGVVVGMTFRSGERAMRWAHLASTGDISDVVRAQIRQALDASSA